MEFLKGLLFKKQEWQDMQESRPDSRRQESNDDINDINDSNDSLVVSSSCGSSSSSGGGGDCGSSAIRSLHENVSKEFEISVTLRDKLGLKVSDAERDVVETLRHLSDSEACAHLSKYKTFTKALNQTNNILRNLLYSKSVTSSSSHASASSSAYLDQAALMSDDESMSEYLALLSDDAKDDRNNESRGLFDDMQHHRRSLVDESTCNSSSGNTQVTSLSQNALTSDGLTASGRSAKYSLSQDDVDEATMRLNTSSQRYGSFPTADQTPFHTLTKDVMTTNSEESYYAELNELAIDAEVDSETSIFIRTNMSN